MAKGRPTKLTPKVQDAICTAIEYGAPLYIAAKYGGVHEDTVLNWRNKGEAVQQRLEEGEQWELTPEERAYIGFFGAVEAANAKAMLFHLQNLTDSAHINPQNSMWILERRWPDVFGRPQQRVDVTSAGAPIGRITTIEVIHHPADNDPAASRDT